MDTVTPAQLAVDVMSPRVRVIRVAGRLDRVSAARVVGLVAAQCSLAATCTLSDVVLDLSGVTEFRTDAVEVLRSADAGCERAGVVLHLAGCTDRLFLLPLALRGLLAQFRAFPTVEVALAVIDG